MTSQLHFSAKDKYSSVSIQFNWCAFSCSRRFWRDDSISDHNCTDMSCTETETDSFYLQKRFDTVVRRSLMSLQSFDLGSQRGFPTERNINRPHDTCCYFFFFFCLQQAGRSWLNKVRTSRDCFNLYTSNKNFKGEGGRKWSLLCTTIHFFLPRKGHDMMPDGSFGMSCSVDSFPIVWLGV